MVGKITKIEIQKKNKDRASVHVDGEYWGSLSLMTCAQAGIREGDELDRERWEELQSLHEARQAFDRGLHYLGTRMRSHREMTDYLTRKGFSGQAIDSALQKLEEYGYVNDSEFARMMVRDRASVKRAGRRSIEQELLSKGIARETAEQAMEEYPAGDERDNARTEFVRLSRRYERTADPYERRRKIGAALMRKGFDWDTVNGLLDELGTGETMDD